ncbi:MAG: FAD-dependent oxidoreductase [Polyangiaceae bacterium]|nr:FAD-dependent oxidoreductase [Polyangiaceae bacterium]MCB9606096.1 FAD-dependent oxidoreductase [Polyangiaceae bacterium]
MAEASYESTYQPAAEDTGTRPTRPLHESQVPHWDHEADVVIVGLGGAGAAAAIEACEAGANVLILERASEGGGSTAQSGGIIYFGGGTPVQQACGFEDDPAEMLKYLLMASGPNPDAEKCRLYVEQSLEHFAWFEAQGIEFKRSYYPKKTTEPVTDDCLLYSGNENVWPFDRTARAAPRGHKPKVEGSAGRVIMETLIARVKTLGANIQENARAQTLVVDESGAVMGVYYKQLGEPRYVKASKGVILCAGGFIMNRELVARHVPKLLNVNIQIGNPGDDGAGILMGLGVGAGTLCMGEGFVSVPFYPPSKLVSGIIVNAQGQRFINEDAYHGRTGEYVLQQSGGVAYLILDNECFGRPIAGMQIKAAEESIEELERSLELPEGSLTHTVGYYNRAAERGEDPLFHKAKNYLKPLVNGPFAALDLSVGKAIIPGFTMGGLDTLPTGEVLSADKHVIRGLYAAGRTTAGLPRSAAGYSSGMSIGGATFFGRLAGRRAAAG